MTLPEVLRVLVVIDVVWWAIILILPPIYIKNRLIPPPAFAAITAAPFIFVRSEYWPPPTWLTCHEERHIFQMRVLSPLVMTFLYGLFFLVLFIKYLLQGRAVISAYWMAYKNNPFEVDARRHQKCVR